jgi:hypothetical protein
MLAAQAQREAGRRLDDELPIGQIQRYRPVGKCIERNGAGERRGVLRQLAYRGDAGGCHHGQAASGVEQQGVCTASEFNLEGGQETEIHSQGEDDRAWACRGRADGEKRHERDPYERHRPIHVYLILRGSPSAP